MYEAAVERAEWYSPYLNNLADTYARCDCVSQAISTYEKALKRAPELLITYFDLARLYRRLGEPDQALPYLQHGVWAIDKPELANQAQNRQPWEFSLGHQTPFLPLDNLARQQCYAYRTLAATLRVLNQQKSAAQYEHKSCNLSPGDEQVIQSWVTRETQFFDQKQASGAFNASETECAKVCKQDQHRGM
jgi:tetratricopeptide (TPR) repeat protein